MTTKFLIDEQFIIALASQLGIDINTLIVRIGNLSSLSTTDKTSLVNAVNEVRQQLVQLKQDVLGGDLSSALDTLEEFAAAINNDPTFATTIVTQLNNRLRFDAPQALTNPQQQQALDNLGLTSSTTDYLAVYTQNRGAM